MWTVPNKTKRLLALRVPVRCRDEAEAMGLQLWKEAAAHLETLIEPLWKTRDRIFRLGDELDDRKILSQNVAVLETARQLIDQGLMAFPGFAPEVVARRVWLTVLTLQLALERRLIAPMGKAAGAPLDMRDVLRNAVEVAESKGPSGIEDAEVCRWLFKRSDEDLARLSYRADWDFFEEFFADEGIPPDPWLFTAAAKARVSELLSQAAADLSASAQEMKGISEWWQKQMGAVNETLEAARSMLPDTGEVADFRQVVAWLPGYLDRLPEVVALRLTELRQLTANRVLLRWGVWLELGEVVWTPVARSTLAALIAHPKAFARHAPTGKEAERVAERLRVLRPYCVGFHPEPEQGSLLRALGDATRTDEEVLWLLSDYVIASATRGGGAGSAALLVGRVCDSWAGVPEGLRPELLRRFLEVKPSAVPSGLRTATDEAVEKLAAEETATLAGNALTVARVSPPVVATPSPETLVPMPSEPRGERLCWTYVANPTSLYPRTETVETGRSRVMDAVESLILKHTTPVEPAASLARALYHYAVDMTDAQRQLLNKETAGHYVFHKLKRGAARIYVRKSENTVLFHVYARRDWALPTSRI